MAVHGNDVPHALEAEFERLLSSSPIASRPTVTYSPPTSITSSNPASDANHADPSYPKFLILDVGGRQFKISTGTLIAESGLFQRQMSDRFHWQPEADGSYFLDADPDLFEHLLRFMRRPSVFPLFWSKGHGFDYSLYQRLQAEAKYFEINALHDWIQKQHYLGAVTTRIYEPRTRELKSIRQERLDGNVSDDWHYVPRVRKTYICPRGIRVHYGNRSACGRACREYQGDDDTEYDEEDYLEVVSVQKEVVLDEKVCQMA
ncbi:hypothetical protein N0V95_006307 [Ascochyta clinopodiicola]|nr:hypothetical protein N0V95_006307 [Ascochyta clinopodiicola]